MATPSNIGQWRNRVKGLKWVKASELEAHPDNWRRHPKWQKDALRGVLQEVGFAGALLAYETGEGKLRLVDGHLRQDMAEGTEVPVLVLDLGEVEAKKLLAAYDPLSAMAQADQDSLVALLGSVNYKDEAVNTMLESLVSGQQSSVPIPAIEDGWTIDPSEQLRAKWQVQSGQVWEIKSRIPDLCHRLSCSDSTKRDAIQTLLQGRIPTLIITDPPYGVGYEVDGRNPRWRRNGRSIANDNLGNDQKSFWFNSFNLWPLNGDCYVFAPPGPPMKILAMALEEAGIEHHQWLVWVKHRFVLGRSHYHYRHEHIFYGWKGTTSWQGSRHEDSVWAEDRPSVSVEHPTMKPVSLCAKAILCSSKPSDIVADPFLGSGSTMVAAEKMGRICVGMEIEPAYVAVTLERMTKLNCECHLVT